tara:strand:+ start:1079 stop:1387 length:309 start_codon:yes stop_codon:yes gene_type:complete
MSTKLNDRAYPTDFYMTRRGWNTGAGLLNHYCGLGQYSKPVKQPSANYLQQTFENAGEVADTLEAMDDGQEMKDVPEDSQIQLSADTPMQDGAFSKLPEESI